MYVNQSTVRLSDDDIKSIKLFYDTAKKHELIKVASEISLDLIP